jgi:secretion/DNA translocation related TadE-like protein
VTGKREGERGAAAVLAMTLTVLLVALTGVVSVLGGLLVAHRQVSAAADLAALAGAAALQRGADPCSAAEEVARANEARMRSCRVRGEDVRVEATREVAVPGGTVRVPGRALAGPDPATLAARGSAQ